MYYHYRLSLIEHIIRLGTNVTISNAVWMFMGGLLMSIIHSVRSPELLTKQQNGSADQACIVEITMKL